jgi:formylglycine-generating enzyme required for sulfatase activity/predicted Ser/Thr protein kinase
MADIFISSSRDDRSRTKLLAKALKAQGWSVWWDRDIIPGRQFDQEIQEALTEAKCVVVLWSEKSITSGWVKDEASFGREHQILVPAKIDSVKPPLGFGMIQAADLTDWKGDFSHAGFTRFTWAIANIVGPPSSQQASVQIAKIPESNTPESYIRKYKIIDEIGRGGMGIVYKGEDTELGRTVAIKTIPTQLSFDQQTTSNFLKEAKILAKLQHPNIVLIYDFIKKADTCFLIMEYIQGETLTQRLAKDHRFTVDRAARIVSDVASALAHAHEQGIIHRDIKPENVMITKDGVVKVTDFGIAKLTMGARTVITKNTPGTPCYMSPEQAIGGKAIDERSDIYSLGILFYEIVTGTLPFDDDSEYLVREWQIKAPPTPPSNLLPGFPAVYEQIILKCLAKEKTDRFQKIQDLIKALNDTDGIGGSRFPGAARKGRVYVESEPVNAMVKILNIDQGFRQGMELEPGKYHLELSLPEYAPQDKWIEIGPGEEKRINFKLEFKKKVITNRVGMKFILIPAGRFLMGSPDNEPDRDADERQHEVTITKPFYLQTTEVTQGQWEMIMGNNPSYYCKCGDDCPVDNVSWDDAQQFINQLNQIDRTNKYRLPTEAEWEYACRAGTETAYSFREDKIGKYAWYIANSEEQIHPVGKKKPNAWGLYDMHGNVWEWVQDWYGDYPSKSVVNPKGLDNGDDIRILRGGSWFNPAKSLRSAIRYRGFSVNRNYNIGFRVARSF